MESTDITKITAAAAEVYIMYTGIGEVPRDVVKVQIHSSITKIPDGTFKNCKELKKISFNEGLVKIGPNAFRNCSSLQSISFPSTLIEIGNCAFHSCTNLRVVAFNEGLKKIGIDSFAHCVLLESIRCPSTLLYIGKWAFSGCHSLRHVVLNERIQKVDDFAFLKCRILKEIVLHGEGVYHIGNAAFGKCPSLEGFKLPTLSSRLESIIEVSNQRDVIVNKINAIQGIEKRDSELLIPPRGVESGANWNAVREIIDKIISILDYHEVKEATTTIELAFWKAEIQRKVAEANCSDVDRRSCCIEVPGPVKDTILQYLAYRIYPRGKREKRAFAINN